MGAAAVVFGIGFGLYVYLQLAHPGLFVASPSAPTKALAAPPPAPAQPSAPPAAVAPASSTPSAPAVPSMATALAPANASSTAPTAGTIAAPAADSARPPGNTPGPVPAAAVIAAPKATDAPAIESQRVTAEPARDRAGSKPESAPASKPSPAKAAPPAAEPAAQTRERIEVSATNAQPRLNPMLAQAYSLMQAGKIEDARALYTKVTQAEPLSIDALLGLAYIAGRETRTDEATQLYVRILQLNPRHALAQANLIGLMGRADPGASETRLKQLIAREPSAFLHFVLGNVYAEQSQWSQAQQSYFQAHHLEPGNPDYAYNLAVGLDHLRQAKLALNYYRRAAELAGAQGRGNFSLDHVRERISALAAQLE
jgi:Tfp pilus assembly protein PilF